MARRIILALLLLSGCKPALITEYATVPIHSGAFPIWISAQGEVQAINAQEVVAPDNFYGNIISLAPEGKVVKAGEVIAQLSIDNFEDWYLNSTKQAAIQQGEVQRHNFDLPAKDQEANVALSQARQSQTTALMDWQTFSHGPAPAVSAQASADLLIAALHVATDHYEAQKALYDQGLISLEALHQAELDRDSKAAALKRARLAWTLLDPKAQSDNYAQKLLELDIAQSSLTSKGAGTKIRQSALRKSAAKAAFRAQSYQIDASRVIERVRAATVRAPIAGTVVYPNFQGSKIHAGVTLWNGVRFLEISQLDRLKVAALVSQQDVGKATVGQTAEISIPGLGRTFSGKVLTVGQAPVSEDTGNNNGNQGAQKFAVEVAVATHSPEIRCGMKVQVRILSQTLRSCTRIPSDALFYPEAKPYVWTLRSGKAMRLPVKVLASDGDWVAIKGEFKPSDSLFLLDPTVAPQDKDSTPGDSGEI